MVTLYKMHLTHYFYAISITGQCLTCYTAANSRCKLILFHRKNICLGHNCRTLKKTQEHTEDEGKIHLVLSVSLHMNHHYHNGNDRTGKKEIFLSEPEGYTCWPVIENVVCSCTTENVLSCFILNYI